MNRRKRSRGSDLDGEAGCQRHWREGRAVWSACMIQLPNREMSGHGSYLQVEIQGMFSLSPGGSCRLEKIAKWQTTDSEREDTVYSVYQLDAIAEHRPGDYHKRIEHRTAISKSLSPTISTQNLAITKLSHPSPTNPRLTSSPLSSPL